MDKFLLRNWNVFNENIPLDDSEEGKLERVNLFKDIDVNESGTLSINEVFIVLKGKLKINDPHFKTCIFKAFETTRISRNEKSELKIDDHFLIFKEFKKFLIYLKQYFQYYQMFDIIDANENRKVDIYEFKAAFKYTEKWGVPINDPEKIFNEIDDNNNGVINFDEFCYWAVKNNLKIPDTIPDEKK
jgi:Ca2+-binding EF-hand superfamily protein